MTATPFSQLPLSADLQTTLQELGFESLTGIQSKSLPLLLAGKDLIGEAPTGSGKTIAYSLPLLEKLNLQIRKPQALVLVPTRELAQQVVTEIRKLGRRSADLQVLSLCGGQPIHPQLTSLSSGAHIVVGTPGRIVDLLNRKALDLSHLSVTVLDEADKMLEMGFALEMTSILESLPDKGQMLLFSATIPDKVRALSLRFQKDPVHLKIEAKDQEKPKIEAVVFESGQDEKPLTLVRILQQYEAKSVIIFCNQKTAVTEIAKRLADQNISFGSLHGDLEQRDRNRVLMMFRNGSIRILVATDVAARGLDIDDLEMVINYDLPHQAEIYIHRIGRTGRAGRSGKAICLAGAWDQLKLLEIEKATGVQFQRPELGYRHQHGISRHSIFCQPEMQTLSISGGRKDKLRPGDILGALTGDGGLQSSQIGKIEIQDDFAYVAISRFLSKSDFQKLRDVRIKGRKFQIRLLSLNQGQST